MVHIRTKRPSGKVITRGKPDMREPKGFHSIHMSEPGMSPYQNKNFTQGAEQYTIFDEMKVKMDPWTKRDLGIPSEYSPPGSEFISRASRRRKSLRQPSKIISDNQARLLHGPDISGLAKEHVTTRKVFNKETGEWEDKKVVQKPKIDLEKGIKTFKGSKEKGSEEPSLAQRAKGQRVKAKEWLKEHWPKGKKKEEVYNEHQLSPLNPSGEKVTTEVSGEVMSTPSEVKIPESPKYKRKPKRSDYLYNKQVIKDIKKFESGKGEYIKGKYKRKKR